MNKVLALCIIISLTLFTLPAISYACSCEVPPSVEEEVQRKTAVFSGKVINITEQSKQSKGGIQSTADPMAVLFEVTSTWKGVNETQVLIYTATSSASCGFNFRLGGKYLIYAYGENEKGELITGICDRTALISEATEDLAVLGEGLQPTEEVNLEEGKNQEEYTERDERPEQEEQNVIFVVWLIVGGLFIVTLYFIRYLMKN